MLFLAIADRSIFENTLLGTQRTIASCPWYPNNTLPKIQIFDLIWISFLFYPISFVHIRCCISCLFYLFISVHIWGVLLRKFTFTLSLFWFTLCICVHELWIMCVYISVCVCFVYVCQIINQNNNMFVVSRSGLP